MTLDFPRCAICSNRGAVKIYMGNVEPLPEAITFMQNSAKEMPMSHAPNSYTCLLYTSDAADD